MEEQVAPNETPEEFNAIDPALAAAEATAQEQVTPNETPAEFDAIDPALAAAEEEGEVKSNYLGKQQDLYLYATLGWGYYLANQPAFAEFSQAFTVELGTEQLAFIETTKALPGQEARVVEPLDAKDELLDLNTNVLKKFSAGNIHIANTYTDPTKRATMLKAAGVGYVKTASNKNWSSTESLIAAFKLFLTNYGQAMIDSNQMPPGFPAEFGAVSKSFLDLWKSYKNKWATARQERNIKMKANNLIYKVLSDMCKVGKFLFAKNKTLKNAFTISLLYREVAGLSPAGVQGLCTIGGNKKAPVQFVNFTVKDHPDRTASSDAKGNYKLQLLSEKTYTITATAEGFVPQTFEKYINPGVLSRLNVALVPVPVEPPPADEL